MSDTAAVASTAIAKHEAAPKSSFVQWFVERANKATEIVRPQPISATPESYGHRAVVVGGGMLAGAATAALLGAAHAKFGLDKGGWPMDGILAGVGALGGVALAHHAPLAAAALASVGRTAADVLVFRKSYAACSKGDPMPTSKGGAVTTIPAISAGKTAAAMAGEDPIVIAAEGLG